MQNQPIIKWCSLGSGYQRWPKSDAALAKGGVLQQCLYGYYCVYPIWSFWLIRVSRGHLKHHNHFAALMTCFVWGIITDHGYPWKKLRPPDNWMPHFPMSFPCDWGNFWEECGSHQGCPEIWIHRRYHGCHPGWGNMYGLSTHMMDPNQQTHVKDELNLSLSSHGPPYLTVEVWLKFWLNKQGNKSKSQNSLTIYQKPRYLGKNHGFL